MTLDEYDAFCRSLQATTYVVQWRGAHVWKVGGKVFAIGHGHDDQATVTFKVSEVAYEMLQGEPGLRPAPHLASRGLKWIQLFAKPGLSDKDLKDYLRQSYALVGQGLPKKILIELGLRTQ
jgi:predicted DNA-binding protein (MmcQ/YjbR family)